MATTEAEQATADTQPVTAVSTPMALLLLGDDLVRIGERIIVLQACEADSAKRIRLAGLNDAVQRAMEHYKQVEGDLIRKALGG